MAGRHAQLALQSARAALNKALDSLEDGTLREPLTFTVDPSSPLDGPLDVRVDAQGVSLAPIGLNLRGPDAVYVSWADLEHLGTDLELHARLVRESESMDADLRFLRRLYFRHGGVLRFKSKGSERRPRHPRVHDIRLKLHATTPALRSA